MRNFKTIGFAFLLGFGIATSNSSTVFAQSAETAPQQLRQIISQIDAAANRKDLQDVMQFYSPDFTNSDGLRTSSLSEALTQTWKRFPNLKYTTEIQSWENNGDQLVATTVTRIRGTQKNRGTVMRIDSTIESRQYFQDEKLVKQEILSEKTQLTSGENPPKVEVNLPNQVRVGQKFNFDAIVTEPLNDDVLLGTAIEEDTAGERYLKPGTLQLEVLPAGGIFKVATAPLLPQNRWLSAIVVRGDGITQVTQRLTVVK